MDDRRSASTGSWWLVAVRRCARAALLVVCLVPALVRAQEAPALVVTLRDVTGTGVTGATVLIHDAEGANDLAQAATDTQGTATFATLDADVVRVAVAGTLADGTPLVQRGLDARGIWLLLDGPYVQLDLRVEPSGAVIPDPVTMIAPDVPIEVVPAESAVTLAAPSVPTLPVGVNGIPAAPVLPNRAGLGETKDLQPNPSLLPFLLLALGIGAGVAALTYKRRGAR